jgi:hypothetical protein
MLLPSYKDVQLQMNLGTYLLNNVPNVQASLQKKNVCNVSTLGCCNIQNRKVTQTKQDILSVISVYIQYEVVVFSVIKTTRAA